MTLINFPFFFLLSLSIFFAIAFSAIVYRNRNTMAGSIFILWIGVSVVFWSGGYFAELIVTTLEAKLFWANIKQIGTGLLPLSYLLFALVYTQTLKRIDWKLILLLSLEPIWANLSYWLNLQQMPFRIDPTLIRFGDLYLLQFEIGTGLFVHFTYSGLIALTASVFLLIRYINAKSILRNQISFIFLGFLVPFAGSLLVMMGFIPSQFDMTALLLGFSFPVMAWGLFRSEFFTMGFFNTQSIIDGIPFALLVVDLDNQNRIIGINPKGEEIFSLTADEAGRLSVETLMPDLNLTMMDYVNQVVYDYTLNGSFYQLHCEQLKSKDQDRNLWLIVFVDLTAQKKLEESLFASEAMYRSVVENSIEGIAVVTGEQFTFMNQQMAAMIGYEIDELLGTSYFNLIDKEFLAFQRDRFNRRGAGEVMDGLYQTRLVKKNGESFDAEISSVMIEHEHPMSFLVLVRDITVRKKEEMERSRALALLEATIESSNNGILVVDDAQRVLAHNQQFIKMWHLPINWLYIPANKRYELIFEQLIDDSEARQKTDEVLANSEVSTEYIFKLKSGESIKGHVKPFYVNQDLVGRLFSYEDITAQIQNEERLKASEAKYRLLAENASDVIWTMDFEGNFTYVSPSVYQMRGYTVEEALKQSLAEALTPGSYAVAQALIQENMEKVIRNEEIEEIGNRYYMEQPCKDGSTIWTEVKLNLAYENEAVVGVQGVSRDITERRAYEKEIELSKALAEEHSLELQAALQREQQLHGVTRTISRSMEIDTVLSELLYQTLEITDGDEAHLGLIDDGKEFIHFQYGMDHEKGFSMNEMTPKDEKYFSWHVVNRRQGILIKNMSELRLQGLDDSDFVNANITSMVVVPLLSGLSVLGVMSVLIKNRKKVFTEYDLHAAEAIGTHAGIALQNARLFEEVNNLAVRDPLTHLFNRRHFFNLARVELERAKRYGNDISFILMDIDNFKSVNDSFGHMAGDEVLMAIADAILKSLRSVDLAARYGGEEIVIMLPSTAVKDAEASAERLRQEIEALKVPINGKSIQVTVSLGVSSFGAQSDITISRLLDQADQAMYQSKQKGKNQVSVWLD